MGRNGRGGKSAQLDINTHKIFLQIFRSEIADEKFKGEYTLPEWRQLIQDTNANGKVHDQAKKKLPWLKGAEFGDILSEGGSYRTNENLKHLTAIVVEHDKGDVSFDQAMAAIREAGLRCLGYTSPSYRKDNQRWRLVFPLSRNNAKTQHDVLVAIVNGILGGKLANDSWTLSRAYYFGSVNNNPDHRAEICDGKFLDIALSTPLFGRRIYKDGSKEDPKSRVERDVEPKTKWDSVNNHTDKDEIAAALAAIKIENLPEDTTYQVWFEVASALRHNLGDDGFELFDHWSATATEVYNAKETAKKWKEVKGVTGYSLGTIFHYANSIDPEWKQQWQNDRLENGAELDGAKADSDNKAQPADKRKRPEIKVHAGEHSSIVDLTEKMLIASGIALYKRGPVLVRPIIEEVDASHGRRTKVAQLVQLNPTYTRDLMCRYCDWFHFDKRASKWLPMVAPTPIANTLLARNGDWKFLTIAGCISTPTMRPDGSLLTEPGYDPITRLLMVSPPKMPPPSRHRADANFASYFESLEVCLQRYDAEQALELLEELLSEFPFVDPVAKAVALSGLITPVVRGAFSVAPLHVSRAPVAGSGKSYLWDIAAVIAIGYLMPVMAAGADGEELEKRLGAAVMAGQPLICIDNVIGELGGQSICQLVERPIVNVRVLGRSELVRIEASTTFFASGNNIIIVGDLCRRSVTATLDPRMERPELREFKKDPVEVVLQDRGKYIQACLTICSAYRAAGRPNPAPKLASFEGWSDCVRSALMWLGCADPVQSIEIAREEDPERLELSEMLTAWINNVGLGYDSRVKLAAVIALVEKVNEVDQENPYLGKEKEPAHPELLTAVTSATYTVTRRRGQKPDIHSLGQWLRARKGRVIDGKRFAYLPNPKGGSVWWVEEADEMAVAQAAASWEAAEKAEQEQDAAAAAGDKPDGKKSKKGKKATRF